MAEFEQAGATERLRRSAILRDMQRRLKRDAAEALGVAADAKPAAIRAAFMALTKQYHPVKFARLDEATVRLANEVFLALREAYEGLYHPAPSRGSSAPPAPPPPLMTSAGTAATGSADSHGAANPAAGRVPRPPSHAERPVRLGSEGGFGNAPAMARSGERAAGMVGTAAATDPQSARQVIRQPRPFDEPRPPHVAVEPSRNDGQYHMTSPSSDKASATKAAATATNAVMQRPISPATNSATKTAVPSPAPIKATSPSPAAAVAAKPPPLLIRFGAATSTGAQGSSVSANQVHLLIARKQWPEAKQVLQLLTSREPGDHRHVAWLSYVRAREAIEAGNLEEGRRELQRALAAEPTLEAAKVALAEINAPIRRR
jgi:hypothetical protein